MRGFYSIQLDFTDSVLLRLPINTVTAFVCAFSDSIIESGQMMDFVRDWRLVVAPVLGVALMLVGVVGCDSGQEIVEPTATMVPDTPAAVVEPTATEVVEPEPTVAVVEPTATRVPSTATPVPPTATVEAEAEVTAEVDPYVSSLTDRVYELTIMLAEELSPRQSATEEELEAAMYLLAEMKDLGYEVEIQDFEVTEAGASGSLEVLPGSDGSEPSVTFSRRDGDTHRIFFLPFEPIKIGQTRGEMVFAGLGDDDDFEGVDVDGKIVMLKRGTLSFEEKETNAAERGAIAVVVFNYQPRFYFGGRLDQEPDILAGGIPQEDGERLQRALDDGNDVNAEILVYPTGNGPSRNVIAELNNDIAGDRVVVIGAHYDTTPWSVGANDNGSGVATALIVAEELADDELPFDVRFVFFGSEETGLHGSNHYAGELSQAEVDRIEVMINLDVVATGDLKVFGDFFTIVNARDVAEKYGIGLTVTEPFQGASSDYAGFDERGVPYVMFYADNLDYINHPSDTVEHVEAEPLGGTVVTVLGLIEALADSIEE